MVDEGEWRQAYAEATEKARKRKLVGGNRGAWAHSKEQAKGKADPEKYARATMARICNKSLKENSMPQTAQAIYNDFLRKSPGSRGGHVIGQTRTGKPIYAASHSKNQAIKPAFVHGSGGAEMARAHPSYTANDHIDASRVHEDKASSHSATKEYARAHRSLAQAHSIAADIKGR